MLLRCSRALAGFALLLVAGCGDDPGPASSNSLRGRAFLSESVTQDGKPYPLVTGTRIRLAFGKDGDLTATAGCNTMGGPVEITSNRLVVGDLSMTEMGCDEPRHGQDTWLADLLGADPGYTLDGDRLRVTGERATIELLDREVADPDRPLVGTAWSLDGIISGSAVSSVPAGASATLRFTTDSVTFDVKDCNHGGGDVDIDATSITIGQLNTTDIACQGDAAVVESAITAVLRGSITYKIEAASLTLSHPAGHGITLRAT